MGMGRRLRLGVKRRSTRIPQCTWSYTHVSLFSPSPWMSRGQVLFTAALTDGRGVLLVATPRDEAEEDKDRSPVPQRVSLPSASPSRSAVVDQVLADSGDDLAADALLD